MAGESRAARVGVALGWVGLAALGAAWAFPQLPAAIRGWWAGADLAACDPSGADCRVPVGAGWVSLRVTPPDAPPAAPLHLAVGAEGAAPVAVTLTGIDMAMGVVRAPLAPDGAGWAADVTLPACTLAEMRWRADVELADGGLASFVVTSRKGAEARTWDEFLALPTPTYPPLALRTASGVVASDAWPGDPVVVYFGYTSCPDVCPTTLSTLAAAVGALSPGEAARVHTLFVTLDPERDPLDRLAAYAAYFHPSFVGGQVDAPGRVAAAWGVSSRKTALAGSDLGYAVDHGTSALLRRPDGAVEALPHGATGAEVAERLRAALSAP